MLKLPAFNLSGSISPHVGNLSFLRVIHLQNNSFSHQIPPEIGRLPRLQDLILENNSLTQLIRLLSAHQTCSWLEFFGGENS